MDLVTDSLPAQETARSPEDVAAVDKCAERTIKFEFLPGPPENSDLVTLFDASGREFHTTLRISDLEYLLKQNFLNNMKNGLKKQKKVRPKAQVSETNQYYSTNGAGRKRKFEGIESGQVAQDSESGIRTLSDLQCSEYLAGFDQDGSGREFDDLPLFGTGSAVSLETLERSFPPALEVVRKPKKPAVAAAIVQRPKGERGKGNRCRKVYGLQNRDMWCKNCQWKKSCKRFAPDGEGESASSVSPSPVPGEVSVFEASA